MLQVYFLSIIFIMLAGMVLSCLSLSTSAEKTESKTDGNKKDKNEKKEIFRKYLKFDVVFHIDVFMKKNVRLFIGFGSVLTGILLILTPNTEDIAVIGDLIPALLGIAGGLLLVLLSLGKQGYEGKNKYISMTFNFLNANVNILGLLMLIMGFLHIFFPSTPLL